MSAINALLQSINRHHGTHFIAHSHYPHGEQGAVQLIDPDGKHFVLKVSSDPSTIHRYQQARAVTDLLRPSGYPAPTYVAIGHVDTIAYAIQETLAGTPLTSFSDALVTEILRINALQAQRAIGVQSHWPAPVVEPVLIGGVGFCLLESMQNYSTQTAELLRQLQERMHTAGQYRYPTSDVVHFDYNSSNILVDGSTISGIVDWDGWFWGDRMFDLATLLFYSSATRSPCLPFWDEVCQAVGPAIGTIYLAHIIHRQVDWSIRYYDQTVTQHWLNVADYVLEHFCLH